jgi:hypothetical protein
VILKGSQRAGAGQLATHLLNDRDNDHVTVLEVRGFVADDLHGALAEAQAISKGTQCKQFMFSLSLNPPKEAVASEADFERAADEAEQRLGLSGQPRAIIIHEKEGRRHAHVVWSRIKADEMRAINMAHFKNKLTSLSKELYLEYSWNLPEGLRLNGGKSPLNYTLEEYQQAKRVGLDPREIKQAFQEAYRQSDGFKALGAALEERGYFLAQGDRRGFVALDTEGNIYSVPRFVGVKTKEFRDRMGDGEALPSVERVRADIAARLTDKLKSFIAETKDAQLRELKPLHARRDEYRTAHREQRERLREKQTERWAMETQARTARFRTGLAGLLDKVSGKAAATRQQNMNEAYDALRRDRRQRDGLVLDQLNERSALQERITKMRLRHIAERKTLNRDVIAMLRGLREPHAAERPREGDGPHKSPRKRGFSLDL